MDHRLRQAVDANVGWLEDICAAHGVPSELRDGLWRSVTPPPPLHPDVQMVEPTAILSDVLERMEGRAPGAFKDSFATVDAASAGFRELFTASWIHRDPDDVIGGTDEWSIIATSDELAAWNAGLNTAQVLLPGLLDRGHFRFLGITSGGRSIAGAVATLYGDVVNLSNVQSEPGYLIDWAELARVVSSCFPGRAIVGYETGESLAAAIRAGFQVVGHLRIWTR